MLPMSIFVPQLLLIKELGLAKYWLGINKIFLFRYVWVASPVFFLLHYLLYTILCIVKAGCNNFRIVMDG